MFYNKDSRYHLNRALVALFLGAAAIGFAPIFVRLSELGPSATAFYRMLFSIPVILLLAQLLPVDKEKKSPRTTRDFLYLFLAGLFFSTDLFFWHWSIKLTSVANATLLANTAPIFVSLAAFFFFGERQNKVFFLGLISAFIGLFFLLGGNFETAKDKFLGDCLGVLAAIFYAAYMVTISRLTYKFSTITIMAWSSVFSALVLIPVTIFSNESFVAITASGWMILFALAAFSHAGGQSLIAYSFSYLSPTFASLGLLFQPVIAALLAWLIFSEALSLEQAVGGATVLLGIYIARMGNKSL